VNFLFTQNLVSIVFCAFKRIKGRFASALDTLERAALCVNYARLFGAVQPSLVELRLDRRLWGHSPKGDGPTASNRPSHLQPAFGKAQPSPKAIPSLFFAFVPQVTPLRAATRPTSTASRARNSAASVARSSLASQPANRYLDGPQKHPPLSGRSQQGL
jgi:hypothetical protein